MPLVAAGELVARAADARTAVDAFNVITLEHVEAVVGAETANAPVILKISENAVKFRRGRLLPLARAAVAAAEHAAVPVALHLDHVQSDDLLRQAASAGFRSVMFDAAHPPMPRTSPPPGPPRTGPMPKGCGSRPSWVRSAERRGSHRWTPTRRGPVRTRPRPTPSSPTRAWTRWPWRSAAATP